MLIRRRWVRDTQPRRGLPPFFPLPTVKADAQASVVMAQSTPCDSPQRLPWQSPSRPGIQWLRLWIRPPALLMLGCTVALALTVAWTGGRLQRQLLSGEDQSELIYLPPVRFLRALSLRYEHAFADVLWFRAISYFGHHYRRDRMYPWLAHMCDVVTDLDPQAEHVYRFGGLILPWEADRIDDGIALLEKGARNMPDSWELRYMLGFSYYFFKDDLEAASRALRQATLLPGASEYVSRLLAVVDAAQHGPNSAMEFLAAIEEDANNEEVRAAIHQRIGELALARDIDALTAAVGSFQANFGRPPGYLGELVATGFVAALPREPFGGQYVLDRNSGEVRSSLGHQPLRLGSSKSRESYLKNRSGD